jgi:ABC-type amino acid transport substrate-binding protein
MTYRKDLNSGMLLGGKRVKLLLILACTSIALGLLSATPDACRSEAGPREGYRIGIYVTGLPFIEKTPNGSYIGADLELWQEIARRVGFSYHYREMHNIPETLQALAKDELDFALATTTVTCKRSKLMMFSYPYYVSGQAILVNAKEMATLWVLLEVLCSRVIIHTILALLLLLLVYGHILWLAERGKNPLINNQFFPGVFEAMWCAFAIKSTIGFGDVVPHRWMTRVLAVPIWLSGILLASVISAQLISAFVADRIKPEYTISDYRDLRDKKVAVVEASTGMIAVADIGVKDLVSVMSTDEGYRKLLNHEADAFVFDYPYLAYETNKLRDMGHHVMIIGVPFTQEFYAIPMSTQLAAREPDLMGKINSVILEMHDEKYLDRLRQKWISDLVVH